MIKLQLELSCGGVGVNYLADPVSLCLVKEQTVLYTKYEH